MLACIIRCGGGCMEISELSRGGDKRVEYGGRIWHRRLETKWAVSQKSPHHLHVPTYPTDLHPPSSPLLVALIYGACHTWSGTPPLKHCSLSANSGRDHLLGNILGYVQDLPQSQKSWVKSNQLGITQHLVTFHHSSSIPHLVWLLRIVPFCFCNCGSSLISRQWLLQWEEGTSFWLSSLPLSAICLSGASDWSELPAGPTN